MHPDSVAHVLGDAAEVPGAVRPVIPQRPGTVVHALKVLQALLVAYVAFLALFIKWLSPRPLPMLGTMLFGIVLGLGYSFLHHYNKARKERLAALVRRRPCLRASHVPRF